MVLSAASSFFKNLLISHSYTNTHPILFLKGVKMVDLESVLQYIYHGEANVGVTNLDSFFEVGAELQIKGLTSLPTPLAGRSLLKRNYAVAGPEQGPEQVTTEEELAAKRLRSSDTVKQEPEPAVECKEEREVGQEAVEAAGESSSQLGVIHRSQAGAPDWGGVRARTGAQETAAYDSSVASGMSSSIVSLISSALPAEVKRLTDGYLERCEAAGGSVFWRCTRCGKQGKMKHHVREHIESNHIDCLTFPCTFCGKEMKNRVAMRSHISKNHREENLRSKGQSMLLPPVPMMQ